MRRHGTVLGGLLALGLLAPDARAEDPAAPPTPSAHLVAAPEPAVSPRVSSPRTHHGHSHRSTPRVASVSLGYANGGRLEHSAHLEPDEALRYLPGRTLHYGTDELVGLLHRAARTVFRRHHARLTVGDLSARDGGPVGHHASHQSGRDADVAFYVLGRRGEPVALEDYVCFDRNGRPIAGGPWRFDVVRNWALVEALLEDRDAVVEHIFVSHGLRNLLLAHARAAGASPATLARAAAVMHQPGRGLPHTNHFHVRIGCPAGDAACIAGVRAPHRRPGARRQARNDRSPRARAARTQPSSPDES